MKYDPDKHYRHSIRLKGYDYGQSGAYFVTVVTQDRACLFGEIVNGKTLLNDAGGMIEHWWFELNHKFPTVETDEFVVMPNHFHGIVAIADVTVGADLRVGLVRKGAHAVPSGAHTGAPLPTVVQWFKTMTTNEYIRGVKTLRWTPFRGQLWQRNYYEYVIRDEESLDRIRRYILDNPARWTFDHEKPAETTLEPEDAWRD